MSSEKIRGGVYAVTADTGQLALQAKLLIESIKHCDPDSTIILFIPSESVNNIDSSKMETFEEAAEIVTGKFPIPEYPPSALQKAFVEASEYASSGPVIALDSDTILTAPLTHPATSADAYIRPGGFASRYWGSERSEDDWQVIFDYFDVEFPDKTIYSFGDRRPFFVPFYNAGVVFARDSSFAEDWLEITKELIYDVPLDLGEEFFVDQIALAVLDQQKEIKELTGRQNFQPRCRLRCPDDVEVVHYHNFANLYWVSNPAVRERIKRLESFGEVPTDISFNRIIRLHLNRLYIYTSRIIPYPFNQFVYRTLQKAASRGFY